MKKKKKKLKDRRYNKNKLFVFVDLVDGDKIDELSLKELKTMRRDLRGYAARLNQEIELDKKGR